MDEASFRELGSNDWSLQSLILSVREVISTWGGKLGKVCAPHQASTFAINWIIPEDEFLPLLLSGNGFFVVPAGDQSCFHKFVPSLAAGALGPGAETLATAAAARRVSCHSRGPVASFV